MAFKRPALTRTPIPVPPTPVPAPEDDPGQFEEIEQLQLLIIEEQASIMSSLENIKALSILAFDRIRSVSTRDIPLALEIEVKSLSRRATILDEKVEDQPVT